LYDGFTDNNCVPLITQLSPLTSPSGTPLDHISHGGQLGAPFSHMDCANRLGDPCIRGQWQHTRHYVGKGNPRDVFAMDFHSNTPKGVFDTLDCACLGCCNPDFADINQPNGKFAGAHKFTLCNPDDHKVCGPEPRPAPANAIIFTGIGKVTPTDDIQGGRAAQAEWVVFRVYIEDRSEPGGGHPGGAVEPADVYCFQAWTTGIKVTKKPNFDQLSQDGQGAPGSALAGVDITAFRTALSTDSCNFIQSLCTAEQLASGATCVPPGTLPNRDGQLHQFPASTINDCGPLHDGNHQIHPATGATCTAQ